MEGRHVKYPRMLSEASLLLSVLAAGFPLQAMSKAVEDASVVLIAASQKYKQSSNCQAGKCACLCACAYACVCNNIFSVCYFRRVALSLIIYSAHVELSVQGRHVVVRSSEMLELTDKCQTKTNV